jgi:hypothetical protein
MGEGTVTGIYPFFKHGYISLSVGLIPKFEILEQLLIIRTIGFFSQVSIRPIIDNSIQKSLNVINS